MLTMCFCSSGFAQSQYDIWLGMTFEQVKTQLDSAEEELFYLPTEADPKLSKDFTLVYTECVDHVCFDVLVRFKNDSVSGVLYRCPTELHDAAAAKTKKFVKEVKNSFKALYGKAERYKGELLHISRWTLDSQIITIVENRWSDNFKIELIERDSALELNDTAIKQWDERALQRKKDWKSKRKDRRKRKRFDPDKVPVGTTREELEAMYGPPAMEMQIMDELILTYGDYMVTMKDGTVVEVEDATAD